jgi:hypothetical protein
MLNAYKHFVNCINNKFVWTPISKDSSSCKVFRSQIIGKKLYYKIESDLRLDSESSLADNQETELHYFSEKVISFLDKDAIIKEEVLESLDLNNRNRRIIDIYKE